MTFQVKPALWIAFLSVHFIVLAIFGACAGQSSAAAGILDAERSIVLTATLTATPTITLTITATPTLTATPVSSPTHILTPPPTSSSTPTSIPTTTAIVIEDPDIHPAYSGLCTSAWYLYTNDRGHPAYLTLNVNDPNYSTNWAEWRPVLPEAGYYSIEAYIPAHSAITWNCPKPRLIPFDTADAHYSVQHANGQTVITGTQSAFNNDWLPLGEYFFRAGSNGSITLSDLNTEENYSTTVSFSAVRFTWLRPPPKFTYLPIINGLASPKITSIVGILNAPALDQCLLPTTTQMQTWWNNSPYRITNVYIGGGMLYHGCSVPDRNWIETVRAQGWGVIPTWVGPQAPCSGYHLRMSSDPATAFLQGQVEADAAIATASAIGLTISDTMGSIIYYDVEGYNPAKLKCREAVNSFIAGWTERLNYRGNRSGSYGGACTSYLSDWAKAVYPPQNVWVADWIYKHYKENVPLFGITCLPDTLWPNHQRILQYASAHNETYGGVTFDIDSNIADAEVVIPSQANTSLLAKTYISSNTDEISDFGISQNTPELSWIVENGSLYLTQPNHLTWQPLSTLDENMTIHNAFFLDESTGWVIASTGDANNQLFSTSDGGRTWRNLFMPPLGEGWYPASLQFSNLRQGWITTKQATGSNFSIGRLLRTDDGGGTWQSSNLPIGGAVVFTSQEVGWVAGGVAGNQLYRTQDGGHTWDSTPLPLPAQERATLSLPVFIDTQNAILPVVVQGMNGTRLDIYSTHNGGNSWAINYTLTQIPEGFDRVSFTSALGGWSITRVGDCINLGMVRSCSLHTALWGTNDGGDTWTEVKLP